MYEIRRSKPDDRRYHDKQESSKVLLVCVYDTIAVEVTNQLIYENFSKFGPIVRVLIFDKAQVTKLFVQYTQRRFAQEAKSTLDGTKLLGAIGKMNIYYSNFSNVDLRNETSEGADYTMRQEMKNEYMRRFDQMSKSFQSKEHKFLDEDSMFQSIFNNQFPARSKTDNPQRLQDQIHRLCVTPNYQNSQRSQSMVNEEQEIDHAINKNINSLFSSPPSFQLKNSKPKHTLNSPAEKVHPAIRFKSSVLKFSLTKDISIRCIYNLFSNFGNISFISKKIKEAYIKFRSLEFAAIARTYLNQKNFMGNLLLLQYPEQDEQASPRQLEYSQCFYYDQTYNRFTPYRSLTVNSPSQTLHISSIKKDICKENTLYNIFSQFGKVQAVKILCCSNEKNMALVKFYSIEDSFYAIAYLHNQIFSGRKVQISFTKSRI